MKIDINILSNEILLSYNLLRLKYTYDIKNNILCIKTYAYNDELNCISTFDLNTNIHTEQLYYNNRPANEQNLIEYIVKLQKYWSNKYIKVTSKLRKV